MPQRRIFRAASAQNDLQPGKLLRLESWKNKSLASIRDARRRESGCRGHDVLVWQMKAARDREHALNEPVAEFFAASRLRRTAPQKRMQHHLREQLFGNLPAGGPATVPIESLPSATPGGYNRIDHHVAGTGIERHHIF